MHKGMCRSTVLFTPPYYLNLGTALISVNTVSWSGKPREGMISTRFTSVGLFVKSKSSVFSVLPWILVGSVTTWSSPCLPAMFIIKSVNSLYLSPGTEIRFSQSAPGRLKSPHTRCEHSFYWVCMRERCLMSAYTLCPHDAACRMTRHTVSGYPSSLHSFIPFHYHRHPDL